MEAKEFPKSTKKTTFINCTDITDIEVDGNIMEITTYRDYMMTAYVRSCADEQEALDMARKLNKNASEGISKIPFTIARGLEFKTRSFAVGG